MAQGAFFEGSSEPSAARAMGGIPQAVQDPPANGHRCHHGNAHVRGVPGQDVQDLQAEVAQLRRAMETRPAIDQACGVLMATFGLSPQMAWTVLVTTSQNTNTKLHRVASHLVGTVRGEVLPKQLREQLSSAVAKTKAAAGAPGPGAPASPAGVAASAN